MEAANSKDDPLSSSQPPSMAEAPQITPTGIKASSLDGIGASLLSQGLDLAALELLQEAIDLGRESEVIGLRAHFNDPKYSDALHRRDALSAGGESSSLSIEMREQVVALLTPPKSSPLSVPAAKFPLTTLERKVLNSLVQGHLLSLNCRATAISLTQEIGEKSISRFEDVMERWGISSKELVSIPSLTEVFRFFLSGADPTFAHSLFDELEKKNKAIEDLKKEATQLSADLERERDVSNQKDSEISRLRAELQAQVSRAQTFEKSLSFSNILSNVSASPSSPRPILREPSPPTLSTLSSSPSTGSVSAKPQSNSVSSSPSEEATVTSSSYASALEAESQIRKEEPVTKEEPIVTKKVVTEGDPKALAKLVALLEKGEAVLRSNAKTDSKEGDASGSIFIAQQVNRLSALQKDYAPIISLLSHSLPRITKGVILPKREELLPLILVAICWNDDKEQRLELTSLLFHLIRNPSFDQRRMILAGCVWLASLSDPERTANELLPQCWENVDSDLEERRLLVADSCGFLASKVKSELRLSLLFSIVSQLSDDLSPSVRAASALNLSRLLLAERRCDSLQKFGQVEDLVHKYLKDPSESVSDLASSVVAPIFIDWAISNDLFFSSHCEGFLKRALTLCQRVYDERSTRSPLASLNDSGHETSAELAPVKIPPKDLKEILFNLESLTARLTDVLGGEFKPQATAFISSSLFPFLVRLVALVDLANLIALKAIFSLIGVISNRLGAAFIMDTFFPLLNIAFDEMEAEMKTLKEASATEKNRETFEPEDSDDEQPIEEDKYALLRRKRTWLGCARLAVSVLSSPFAQWEPKFKEAVIFIGREENEWKEADLTLFQALFAVTKSVDPNRLDQFVQILIELSSHSSQRVQNLSVKLVSILAQHSLTEKQIIDLCVFLALPLFGALSNNAQGSVKIATLTALSMLLTVTNNVQIVTTAKNQIDAIVKQSSRKTHREVVRIFAKVLNDVPRPLRDEFILPHLYQFAKANQEVDSAEAKKKMIEILFKIFRRIAHDVLPPATKKDFVIPTLEILQSSIGNDPQDVSIRSELGTLLVDLRGGGGSSSFGFSKKDDDADEDSIQAPPSPKKKRRAHKPGEDSDSDSFSDKIGDDEQLELQIGSISNAISAKFTSLFKK